MKIYTLESYSFDSHALIGVFASFEAANKSFDFVRKKTLERNKWRGKVMEYAFLRDSNYRHASTVYKELTRFKNEKGQWEDEWNCDMTFEIKERNLDTLSFDEQVSKIKQWQKNKKNVKNWPHCSGKPDLDYGDHVVLKCPTCTHIQTIPDMIYDYEEPKKKKK